jgi:excisionase family DNA binding protein
MKDNLQLERTDGLVTTEGPDSSRLGNLPNGLRKASQVAAFVGCHEESVRRAYLRGHLRSQRFGARNRRFSPADVLDWIARGAPTGKR